MSNLRAHIQYDHANIHISLYFIIHLHIVSTFLQYCDLSLDLG